MARNETLCCRKFGRISRSRWPTIGNEYYVWVMRATYDHRIDVVTCAPFRALGLLLSVVALLALAGCTTDATATPNDQVFDQIAADVTATAVAPTAIPTAAAEPTATPEPTATHEPTPDPRFDQAETIALEYYSAVIQVFGDARNVDLTRMIELEAPGSPLQDYALRITAELIETNHYLAADEVTLELVEGSARLSEWRGEEIIAVKLCVQTEGIWRDFDTDEVVMESLTEPFPAVVRLTATGPLLVSSFTELVDPEDTCDFDGSV